MDSHPDVAQTRDKAPTVCCDQAIFTSVRSPMGSGYRLISASRTLRPNEKQHIVTRCPSHDGLSGTEKDATGVALFQLPTGRYCVTYTCTAGKEHTNRGGYRIYTRVVVLDQVAFAAFSYNAFDVCRSLLAAVGPEPDLKPSPSLPALELSPQCSADATGLAQAVHTLGVDWFRDIVRRVLLDETILLVGSFPHVSVAEAVVLSIPTPIRARFSFSAGLRFSLSRGVCFAALEESNVSRLRQTLHGHRLVFLQPEDSRFAPQTNGCEWARLAGDRWQAHRGDELIALSSGEFADDSYEGIQRYGRMVLRRDTVDQLDVPSLLRLLLEHFNEEYGDEVLARWGIQITTEAIARLTDELSTAPVETLAANWDHLLCAWRRSRSSTALLDHLMGAVLMRATRLDPVTATAMALALSQTAQATSKGSLVERALDDLLDHLGEWIHDQPRGTSTALLPTLECWPDAHSHAERVQRIKRMIAGRQSALARS